jgi:hypothetical protein
MFESARRPRLVPPSMAPATGSRAQMRARPARLPSQLRARTPSAPTERTPSLTPGQVSPQIQSGTPAPVLARPARVAMAKPARARLVPASPGQAQRRAACPVCGASGPAASGSMSSSATCPVCDEEDTRRTTVTRPELMPPTEAAQARRNTVSADPAEAQADAIGEQIGRDLGSAGGVSSGPLPRGVGSVAEKHLGIDLSGTELRADAAANRHAESMGALAVTEGSRVSFAKDRLSVATTEGRSLLGHELTHVAQQRAYRAAAEQRQADPSASDILAAELEAVRDAALADSRQDVDVGLRAYASRLFMLLNSPHPPITTEKELDLFVSTAKQRALTEMDTLGTLTPDGQELALIFTPHAFPLTWSGRIHAALTLGPEIPKLAVSEFRAAEKDIAERAKALGPRIFEHGLPVPLDQLERLKNFELRVSDAAATKPSPVQEYAAASVRYMQTRFVSSFAFRWELAVADLDDGIKEGRIIASPVGWNDFVKNKQAHLRNLPARAREILARSEEEARAFEKGALSLVDAAAAIGMVSALSGVLALMDGWKDASNLFDDARRDADGLVASSNAGARIVAALQWGLDNGYFGGAVIAFVENLISHGPEILASTAVIVGIGFIPGAQVPLAILLALTAAAGAVEFIDELGSALDAVMQAQSVGELQQASARLAAVLTSGAITILIVLVTQGIARAAIKVRTRAAELRAKEATLSQEAAEQRALQEMSAAERAPLEQGPAKIATKFKDLADACLLGTIRCRTGLPRQIQKEAGPYPKTFVPFPKDGFDVQSSALTTATRRSGELQKIIFEALEKNPKLYPEFRKALAAARRRDKDATWPSDEDGSWDVHHIKPINMGGASVAENLIPVPKSVHRLYNAYWNKVYHGFKSRFTDAEWNRIYTKSTTDVPGSEVPKARRKKPSDK